MDRIVAQTWDSAADISELHIGVPRAVFPNNVVMQNALTKYIMLVSIMFNFLLICSLKMSENDFFSNNFRYHMKSFHQVATVHYMRSSQQFHRNLCRAPALFLISKTDPVGAEESNRRVFDSWESMGIKVFLF